MSNALNRINVWFDRFDERFSEAPNIIGEGASEFFRENFATQSWNGVPWPKRKDKLTHPLLRKNNLLFASIKPSFTSPERVVVSAGSPKVPYARIHNEGGRVMGIRNVRPYTNSKFMGKGPVQIKAHTRRVDFMMPRRQFMGHSPILNEQIMQRLKRHFNTV
jgi:phage gpG-like protein